jgi:hypothetical protein
MCNRGSGLMSLPGGSGALNARDLRALRSLTPGLVEADDAAAEDVAQHRAHLAAQHDAYCLEVGKFMTERSTEYKGDEE